MDVKNEQEILLKDDLILMSNHDKKDKDQEILESSDKMKSCKLCYKDAGRYTCPRCNIPYCSSVCYKCEAHAQCSEQFYKECFMEGLKVWLINSLFSF